MTDAQKLIAEYVKTGSEPAFRELVMRYVDLVYSTALRLVGGDAHLAEDVAQTVFVRLARKAGHLPGEVSMGGWLHRDTCYVAATIMRGERRRQIRERQAVEMNTLQNHSEADLSQVLPLLDEAINELGDEDRTAVMLRFFEQCDFRSVGESLGSSEDAARMRVNRALEKLHGLLRIRGVALSTVGLATILGTKVVAAAPTGLATGITVAALGSAAASGGGLSPLRAVMAKWKAVILPGTALVVVLGIGLYFENHQGGTLSLPPTSSPASAASAENQSAVQDQTSSAVPLPANTTNTPVPHMNFQVVDAETGAPLANAKLRVNDFREGGNGKTVNLATDANGVALIELPRKPYNCMNLFVTSDGHVPKVVSWSSTVTELPTNYCMKVEAGTTVGGMVVDEEQQPVANVTIEFDGPGIDLAKKENIQFGPDTVQHTDVDGHWSCNMIPASYETLGVILSHSDFAVMSTNIVANAPAAVSNVLVIRRGVAVAGSVADLTGQPITGASIREVQNRQEPPLSAKTDGTGRFEFKHVRPGGLQLAVQAKGFSPVFLETNVPEDSIELKFNLGPGHILRGRVVDENGTPITNAVAQTDWDNQGLRKIEWSARTDAQGRFEWDSAPGEPLLYWFEAEEFNWSRGELLPADGADHEIKLSHKGSATAAPTPRITGTAVDAETGQPLGEFKVLIGEIRIPDSAPEFSYGTDGSNGKFSLSLASPCFFPAYQIQIQKDGYEPVASTNFLVKDGNQTLEFRLHRGSGLAGIVVLPGGEPATNATVFLYEARGSVYMDKPGQFRKEPGITTENRVQTDDAGKFSFAPTLLTHGLIAIHDLGYAEVTAAAFDGRIVLQPWGRVEGRLLIGNHPSAGKQISLGNVYYRYGENGREFPPLSLWLETTTDADGNFVFEKVPPGERTICQRLTVQDNRPGRIFENQKGRIVVAPGIVTRVELGSTGRSVVGRAAMPGVTNDINWQNVVVELSSKLPGTPGQRPNQEDFSSTDAFLAALRAYAAADRAFWTSAVGRRIQQTQRNYAAFCNPDGSFLLPDIPPGTYELKIEVENPNPASVGPSRLISEDQALGSLNTEVTVPDVAENLTSSPMDLGTLELKVACGK